MPLRERRSSLRDGAQDNKGTSAGTASLFLGSLCDVWFLFFFFRNFRSQGLFLITLFIDLLVIHNVIVFQQGNLGNWRIFHRGQLP
jgi:hypothetical protein